MSRRSIQSFRSHRLFVLATCCWAVFTDIFFYGVLPPILPKVLPDRAGVALDQVQTWVAAIPAIYCASLVLTSPFAGVISDRSKSRRPLFIVAVVFQMGGIGLLTVGTSLAFWIAGVAVAGCSSGLVWASSLAIILDMTPQDKIAETLGYVGVSLSCGVFVGPVLGGVVYQTGGHYAVWSMCFGLAGLDLILRLLMVEPRAIDGNGDDDSNGQTRTSRASSITFDVIDIEATDTETKGQTTLPDNTATTTSSYNSNPHSSQPTHPAILTLWTSPRFTFAILASTATALIATSLDGALPLHAQQTFNFTPLSTGLLYLAVTITGFLQPLVGRYIDAHSGFIPGTLGFLLTIPTFTCLRFVDHDSLSQKILLVILLLLISCSITLCIPVYVAEVSQVVFEREVNGRNGERGVKGAFAQANALWSAAWSVGCVLGPVWGGEIQKVAGWKTESWTVALLGGVMAVLAFFFTGRKKTVG